MIQPAPIKEPIVEKNGFLTRVWLRWFQIVQSLLDSVFITTKRITSADSPYTTPNSNFNLLCDTDGGAITVVYLAGVQNRSLRVANVGSSANDVTLTSTQGIRGETLQTLFDEDVLLTYFDTTEYWR